MAGGAWRAAIGVWVLAGCTADEPTSPASPHPPEQLPPLESAATTLTEVLEPTHDVIEASIERNPMDPAALQSLLADGFGEVSAQDGEALTARTLDDAPPPTPGSEPKLLTRFVHLADIQLADDESPARFASLDTPAISSAFRPQEGHGCRVLNAAVRTINRLDADDPIDFVVLGGDNADNAQRNEHAWVRAILDGAPSVHCDSGVDDDPTAGPANDPKDPFVAEGLGVPWWWVMGNHDVLRQGITPIDNNPSEPVGDFSAGGTRDWSQPGGPVVKGEVVPDEARAYLDADTILGLLRDSGDGHGIDDGALSMGKASYVRDIEGTPLRFVVVDTASQLGGAEGVIVQSHVDAFVEPALDAAQADGKLVIVVSHHASTSLSEDGGVGGVPQEGALLAEQWQTLLSGYDNVVMHLAGHSHVHRVSRYAPQGGLGYWEVVTTALADYPHQMRLVEVWDQDNGFVTVRLVALDYATGGDPVAAEARRRGVADFTSGWTSDARGDPGDRNVELWFPKP